MAGGSSHRCAHPGAWEEALFSPLTRVHEREALFSPLRTRRGTWEGGTVLTVMHIWENGRHSAHRYCLSPMGERRPLCATCLPLLPKNGGLSAQHTSLLYLRVVYIPGVYLSGWYIPGVYLSGWCTCLPTYLRVVYLPPYIPQGVVYTSGCTSGSGIYLRVYLRVVYVSLSPCL